MQKLTLEFLEELRREHHKIEKLNPDPLIFARNFDDQAEGEVAGLVAASLAYGRADQIVIALGKIFDILGKKPRETIMNTPREEFIRALSGFTYRFHKGEDMAEFFHLLRQTLETHESLKAIFLEGGDLPSGLNLISERILSQKSGLEAGTLPKGHPVRFLLASPKTGSAAKRLCLYLRWMARKDDLDPGYWQGEIATKDLIVPLDTHVAKCGRLFGLTERKASDWKTAVEVTEGLKAFSPNDPLRFDFSLFRYGMSRQRSTKKAH